MDIFLKVIKEPFLLLRTGISSITPFKIKCNRTTIIISILLFLLLMSYLGTIFFPIRTITANMNGIFFLVLILFVFLYTDVYEDLSKNC